MTRRREQRQNERAGRRQAADDRREMAATFNEDKPNRATRRDMWRNLRAHKRAAAATRDHMAARAAMPTPPEKIAFFMRRHPWSRSL